MSVSDQREPAPAGGSGTTSRASMLGGAALTALSRAFAQLSQIIVFVFAARILGPADFGFFALISAIAFIALKLSEAGWAEYIMSWSGPSEGIRRICGIAWISGLAMMCAGLVVAGVLPPGIGHGDTQLLLVGFAVWIMLATPSAALSGVMIWQGRIASSAMNGIVAEAAGLAITLMLLSAGYGVLALIGGKLALQCVYLLIALGITRITPSFRLYRDELPELMSFSANILASRLIVVLRSYAAVFIVGGFFGPAAVGYFRAGQRVVGALSELIGEPTRVLAWRGFRTARDSGQPGALQNYANVFFPVLGIISIPGYLWICLFAEPVTLGLFGAEWAPAAPVIALLSVAALLGAMGYATEPLMSLTGNTRILPRLFLVYAVIGILMTIIAGPFGMIAVSGAQVVVGVIIFAINLRIYRSRLQFVWMPVVRNLLPAAVPIAVSFAALVILDQQEVMEQVNPLARAIAISLPPMAIYLVLLALFYRSRLSLLTTRNDRH